MRSAISSMPGAAGTGGRFLPALAAAVLALFAAGGAPALIASPTVTSFTASPSNPAVGQPVVFGCVATGVPSPAFSIDFDDGGSPVQSSVATHTYGAAGTFHAKCTASSSAGSNFLLTDVTVTQTVQKWSPEVRVSVNGVDSCNFVPFCDRTALAAKVGDSLTAYAFDRVTKAQIPPVAASLAWTFAGASPATGAGQGAAFSYAAGGTFPGGIQLGFVPKNGSLPSTLGVSVTIIDTAPPPLTLAIQASPPGGAIGVPITFTATAAGGSGSYSSYAWDFGDQSGPGSGASTFHTYTRAGTFAVTCTVQDAAGPTRTAATSLTISGVQLWLVPGVAWVSGLGGAEWQSDLGFFNPSQGSPMDLHVAFLDGSRPIGSLADLDGKWKAISVSPRATRVFANGMASLFGLEKGTYGAILVRSDGSAAVQPVVNGSTYDVSRGADGTVGLSLPSVALPAGAGAGVQAGGDLLELIGLRDDATHHTNLAVANLAGDYVSAEVTLFGADGSRLGFPVTMELNPFGVRQLTNVLTAPPPGSGAGYDKTANPVQAYRARIRILSGTAVFPYASVIDDVSKDPVLVTGVSSPASSYRLPGIVRTEGKENTLWRSDLVVYNPSASARVVRIVYSWVDGLGFSRTRSGSVPFVAGQTIQWVDFVKSWLSLQDGDANRYLNAFADVSPDDANADPILVTSRVYNNQPTGDVGLGIPGYTGADFASGAGANRRLVLAGLRSDANYRTNVALFLASGSAVDGAEGFVKVYNAAGTQLLSTYLRLTQAGSNFVQLSVDELIAGLGTGNEVLSVVFEDLSGAAVGAYATVVDNRSGDGTLVPGIPSP